MKHTTLASAMAVALTISSAAYAHQNDNILVNPSFEDQGLGWSYWFANIKDDHAYEGEFRGRVAQGVNHHISQIITVPETGYYDLSAYIMSPDNDAIYGFASLADEILLSENVKRNNQDKRYKTPLP
ncbi:hypothetical protein [Vibrio paucivorans]